MQHWDISTIRLPPRQPQILSTTDEGRSIALFLPAGEELQEHQVHERAWLMLTEGEVEVSTADGVTQAGGPGLLCEFAPRERHTVRARTDARLVLLLAPWPGDGHPGAMTLEQKATAHESAAAARP